jgi:hypothetical protein
MRMANVAAAVIQGNFPRVLVGVDTDPAPASSVRTHDPDE